MQTIPLSTLARLVAEQVILRGIRTLGIVQAFDLDQPRADDGKWTDSGGGGHAAEARPERKRDRIEGTQDEADSEVSKAARDVKSIKSKIASAESALAQLGNLESKTLTALKEKEDAAAAKVREYQEKIDASLKRTAELKAKLAAMKGRR